MKSEPRVRCVTGVVDREHNRGNPGVRVRLPADTKFNIPYELYGDPHAYEPDFIARMSNGVHILVESKGRSLDDTAAKRLAAKLWGTSVNH